MATKVEKINEIKVGLNLSVIRQRLLNGKEETAIRTKVVVQTISLSGKPGQFDQVFLCFSNGNPNEARWKYGKNKMAEKNIAVEAMEADVTRFIDLYAIYPKKGKK